MKNKFKFLTRDSLKKKICTKSFKIINIIICLITICLINLDSIVKFFGGDFEEQINVYIVDEVGIYDDLEETMKSGYKDILDNYNAKISKTDKTIDELKEEIIKDETKDIIINVKKIEKESLDKMFNVDMISYDYIDNILYQDLLNALNTTKINMAMKTANISEEVLNSIYKTVEINRIYLDENLNENEELIKLIGSIIVIVFIVPFFILIVLMVQMIGAEINEEKSTKSMEIIISSVTPEAHFMSKLVASNIFAILQGALLLLYAFIGSLIRFFTTSSGISSVVGTTEAGKISVYIKMFLESDMASKLLAGIPFFIILIILSFLAYSLFIGVLASMTTSMEDYNQIQTPVMIFLMLGYYLALYASVYQGAVFIKVASFIPFISGILAPVMYTLGEMTIIDLIISIVLMIITCFLLYKYGLRIYKEGILNYSSSKLWNKIFKSLKNKN
ncbi:MAG: ABC transporter permease [Mollicutes bacterium]|nr:ABC transporter permease [Mollicutes bacterium]